MNKDLLLEFASLKIQEKDIQDKLNLLKDKALSEIQLIQGSTKQPVTLSELPRYAFSVMDKKTWAYSPTCKEFEDQLKGLKKQEEADGTATFETQNFLIFKEVKKRPAR
jgi:hypothetical protein